MNEDELRAIRNLKDVSYKNIWTFCDDIRIVLRLVKKQQEQLENSISKDSIKEQIKWLEHDIEKTKQNIAQGNNFMTYINDYRITRMKAFVTKSKEIKSRLEKLIGGK